jgi:filamentous hemagglutinin family protein
MTQKPCGMTARSHRRLSVVIIVHVSLLLFLSLVETRVEAQVPPPTAPITPSGLHTVVTTTGTVHDITGGTRPGGASGTNLFHSFGTFGVPPDNIANLLNGVSFDLAGNPLAAGLPTSNILARVTGNIRSDIYGTIQTTGFGNANLFLMNPNGFLFGPNATVNVGGIVAFTSADYLRLGEIDGGNAGIFHADQAKASILTNAPVAAFGFIGSNPAAIRVEGSTLTLAAGTGLSLVGGDITIGADPETGTPATLMAPSGEIHLASVASPGEVLHPNLQAGPNINGQSFTTMGNVSLIQGTFIDASGSPTEGTGAGGTIRIRAGQFVMDNAVLYSATQGEVDGADTAVDIKVTGDVSLNNVSAVASQGFGAGRSGDINISANNVLVENLSTVITLAEGDGQAGNIRISAIDTLSVTGTDGEGNFSNIESVTSGSNRSVRAGDSGDITINAATVSLNEGGFIRTRTESDGTARNITLEADNVHLAEGGFIETRSEGDGSTGAIKVTATETVTLVGAEHLSQIDQSQISNRQNGTGSTGGISVTATEFLMTDGAQIFNDSGSATGGVTVTADDAITLSGDSEISSRTVGEEVGPITLSAPTIRLTDQAVLRASTTGGGDAGAISLTGETISLSNQSFLTSRTISSGQGGQITIEATNTILLSEGAIITTSSLNPATGSAGSINIIAGDAVSLSGAGTKILSETAGSGNGGAITIQTNQAQITDGAVISAKSTGSGAAGSVTIQGNSPAQSVLIDGPGSGIFTDTQGTGAGGDVLINTKTLKMQNGGTISAATSGLDEAAIGGDVTVTVSKSVDLRNHASISAKSTGDADAGNITINAGRSFEARNSSVTTKSEHAGGGNIAIDATDQFRLVISQVNASAFLNGGNVTIDPNLVILQKNSQILAEAIQGNGGNITIFTPLFLADSTSLVSAKSEFGLNGTVTIQSPTSNLSESLGTLTSKPNQAQSLLTQRCAALANGQASSFVVAGREQLPADPGSWLTSPLAFAAMGENFGAGDASASAPAIMAIAAHDTDTVSLRRLTPAGFLIANFADSEATGCHS